LRPELRLHVAIEDEVQVDPLVLRAVEGSDRGGGDAAARRDPVAVEDELGVPIRPPLPLERVLPRRLGAGEDEGAEVLEVAIRVLPRGDAAPLAGYLGPVVEGGVDAVARPAEQGEA